MTVQPKPLLVFGWGNLSRGDDALGPLCVQALRERCDGGANIDYLDDYQLQIEHALDLVGRERVLFVDAGLNCRAPFEVNPLAPCADAIFGSHALTPQGLMQVFREFSGEDAPACTLLQIRGERFGLAQPPSRAALEHLAAALQWASSWP
ncbi:MAG: hydrogenase maturation protease [Betaproteobacteria bacterium]